MFINLDDLHMGYCNSSLSVLVIIYNDDGKIIRTYANNRYIAFIRQRIIMD